MNDSPLKPEEALDLIKEIIARVPGFTQLTDADARHLHRAAFVSDHFIANILDLIDSLPPLARALDRTTEDVRAENAEAIGWDAVVTELNGLHDGVVAANLIRRHRVGLFTLQAYNIARQLARRNPDIALVSRMADIRKLEKWKRLKERRRRREKKQAKAE